MAIVANLRAVSFDRAARNPAALNLAPCADARRNKSLLLGAVGRVLDGAHILFNFRNVRALLVMRLVRAMLLNDDLAHGVVD